MILIRSRRAIPLAALLLLMASSGSADEPRETPRLAPQLRRPVVLLAHGPWLLAGNRQSGTISMLDRSTANVVAEHPVAEHLVDMAEIDATGELLVLDAGGRSLRKVTLTPREFSSTSLTAVPSSSAKLAVDAKRRRVFVTATWERRVLAITFDDGFHQAVRTELVELPFAPRELLLLPEASRLLVADAFGGRLAVVDAESPRLLGTGRIRGHNIRGLAVSGDGTQLLVAHQQMAPEGRADYEELHWGRLVRNAVQVLELAELLDSAPQGSSTTSADVPLDAAPSADTPLADGWLDAHGGIGGATADPGGLVRGPGDLLAVAFSGVGEVSLRRAGSLRRLSVGERPGALALTDDRLYVANEFDDSVSVIDLARRAVVRTISLGPAPTETSVERGERLFFDARLSHDGWVSCHSCHTDGHSSGLLIDTLGDGDYGAPKRIPSLLGTRGTGPWGWTGTAATLAEQVQKSVTTTMHGKPLSRRQLDDLVAYLESLPAPPPISEAARRPRELEPIERGRGLFRSRGCAECHASLTFTTEGTFDVGLADELGRRAFNPPSLRGVSQRNRLFHDGRAASLDEVLRHYRHQLSEPLSAEQTAALLAYLRSL